MRRAGRLLATGILGISLIASGVWAESTPPPSPPIAPGSTAGITDCPRQLSALQRYVNYLDAARRALEWLLASQEPITAPKPRGSAP